MYTGTFIRNISGPSVDIDSVTIDTEDIVPPAKIVDLVVMYNNDTKELLTNWTSTGDTHVSIYHLVYASYIDRVIQGDSEDIEEIVIENSDKAGVQVSHTFKFEEVHGDVYVGIRAEDAHGNLGALSNTVYINIPSIPVYINIPSIPTNTNPHSKQSQLLDPNLVLIGSVISIILLLLLSLLSLLIYQVCTTSRDKQLVSLPGLYKYTQSRGVNVHIPAQDNSENDSDTKHNKYHQVTQPSSTSFSNNITPTYWSASQLLGVHEHTHSDGADDTNHHYFTLHSEHPSPQYQNYHHHEPYQDYRKEYNCNDEIGSDDQYNDYCSDILDEALEVNTTDSKSDLNISDESCSTLVIINTSQQGTEVCINTHENVTDV